MRGKNWALADLGQRITSLPLLEEIPVSISACSINRTSAGLWVVGTSLSKQARITAIRRQRYTAVLRSTCAGRLSHPKRGVSAPWGRRHFNVARGHAKLPHGRVDGVVGQLLMRASI